MHRAIWGVVGVALVAGCGSAASEGDNREVIELTTGSRRDALYALAAARNLVLGLDRGDLAAVSEAAIRLGSGSSAITFGEPLATEAAVTRFEEPRPVPKPGVTSCQPTGCDYAHYRDNAFYPNLIDGSITVTTEPASKGSPSTWSCATTAGPSPKQATSPGSWRSQPER